MKDLHRGRRIALSVAFLSVFMTLGFIFLLLAYTGPRWVAFIVFIIYLFVLTFMVKTTRRFLEALKHERDETDEY